MSKRRTSAITELRRAIDCMPRRTRIAMLRGIDANPIIVGAYTDPRGICPMLAAHRNGGRTDFIGFAKAWDRFAFQQVRERKRRARPATRRELLILRSHLESSLLADERPGDMQQAMADHQRLVSERETELAAEAAAAQRAAAEREQARSEQFRRVRASRKRDRPGDAYRGKELRKRAGWRWLRIVRSYDEYERLLEALDNEQAAVERSEALRRELALHLSHS